MDFLLILIRNQLVVFIQDSVFAVLFEPVRDTDDQRDQHDRAYDRSKGTITVFDDIKQAEGASEGADQDEDHSDNELS